MWQVYTEKGWRNIMSNHSHSHCPHDLKYCEHCDVVYCTKCDREWGGHQHYTWYYAGTPYRVTWGDVGYTLTSNSGATIKDPNVISVFNSQVENKGLDFVGNVTPCTHHN